MSRGKQGRFTYRIQSSNDNVSWWVKGLAERPTAAKPSRHDETRGDCLRFAL